jgi:hypothetical protein
MNADALIEMLQEKPDGSLVPMACDWMKENEDDDLLEDVLEEVLVGQPQTDAIDRMLTWFKTNPSIASQLLSPLITYAPDERKKELITFGEKLAKDNIGTQPGIFLAGELIESHQQKQLLPLVEDWLKKNENSPAAGVILLNLFVADPNDENLKRTTTWLDKNPDDWYSIDVLSRLLEFRPEPIFIQDAIARFSPASPKQPELLLLAAPLVEASMEGAEFMAGWLSNNMKHPLAADILQEAFGANDMVFVPALAQWLQTDSNKSNWMVWEMAEDWVAANEEHPSVDEIKKYL